MSEIGDLWADVRADEKRIHEKRKAENLAILRANPSRLPIQMVEKNNGDVVLIRDRHYPAVDFYPSTNKWKVGNRMMMGDAKALLEWLERNRKL